jgi:predicted metal-dependent enzyme (double-stranded beta helix superfamily)
LSGGGFRLSRRGLLRSAALTLAVLPGRRPAADYSPSPAALDIGALVRDCTAALAAPAPAAAVTALLASALADPEAALLALGEPNQSGYEPIYRSPRLTIVNAGWRPGLSLPPHDHAMWSVAGVYTGLERHTTWREAGASITPGASRELAPGQVLQMAAGEIHSLTNPGDRYAGALRIYGGDFLAARFHRWDPHTLRRELTDGEAERLRFERDNRAQQGSAA